MAKRVSKGAVAVDVVLGVVLGALVLLWARGSLAWERAGGGVGGPPWARRGPGWEQVEHVVLPWGAMAGVGLLVVAVAVRRFWPGSAVAVAGGGAVMVVASGVGAWPLVLMCALVVFSAASRSPVGVFLAWAGPVVVGAALFSQVGRPWWGWADGSAPAAVVFAVGAMAVPAGAGVFARARRAGRERERAQEVARSRYEERLSIAREVHDVVGHSLSVISMQASVALHVVDRRPEQASVALAAIRDASREALEELRGTLAVFRDGSEAGRVPVAGLERVEGLAESVRRAGHEVEVVWEGERAWVGSGVEVAAFRIVQEALTNVVRHAPGAGVRVRIGYGPERVVVEVVDVGPGGVVVEGMGIAGMRERARAVRGTVVVEVAREGGVRVWAELPVGVR